jgi:hypothetical protein
MRSFAPLALVAALLAVATLPAQGFRVTPYGEGCGPIATGTVEPNGATHRFRYTISGAAPRCPVLLIVGVNGIEFPIHFGMPCTLLTEPAFTQAHRTDDGGSYTWSHALSSQFRGWARVQFAEVGFDADGNLRLRTTNGLHMQWSD